MKLSKLALVAALACGSYAGNAFADQTNDIQLVSFCNKAACDCGEPACGCEAAMPSCDSGRAPGCNGGCAAGCDGGCDGACGCGAGGFLSGLGAGSCLSGLCGDCCLGDPYTLFGDHNGWTAGGWVSLGYHSDALPLFNDRPDELNLHQAWLYAEKVADGSCGVGFGGRIDYLYGIDAQNTQSFGIPNDHFDNDFDNGGPNGYGHAIPQLYGEVAYGDLSVKLGHFYTIIGWEVVAATGNFFYSHAYTFNFSEPFTHTGALARYNASDDLTIWGGYTMGYDSGFEDNGDNFLGGFSLGLTDKLTLIYATTIGAFNKDVDGNASGFRETGYMHSIIADYALTDSVQYIIQSDYRDTDRQNAGGAPDSRFIQTFGVNQYLIKTISDCWAVGGRFEWWNHEGVAGAPVGNDSDVYALTMGANYKPHANVTVRPEIRFDWDDDEFVGLEDGDDQTTFGIDTVMTF